MNSGSQAVKTIGKFLFCVLLLTIFLAALLAAYLFLWRIERLEVPQSATVVRLVQKEEPESYVIFCSRLSANPIGIPGHCFVVWADKLPIANLSKVESYGYFPYNYEDQLVSIFRDVPAHLASEPISSKPEAMSFSIVAVVSPEVFEKSRKTIGNWEQKKFKLWSDDCIGFTKEVAESVGLKTPERTNMYPQDFIKRLREMNKTTEEIDIKEVTLEYPIFSD